MIDPESICDLSPSAPNGNHSESLIQMPTTVVTMIATVLATIVPTIMTRMTTPNRCSTRLLVDR